MTFTPLEIAAAAFTLVNVWLAVKENLWTWPNGVVSVVLYAIVFWRSHLYLNAWLQLLYFVLTIHGWYEWLRGGEHKTAIKMWRATRRVWATTMPIGALLTIAFFYLERRFAPDASLPVWDSLTTAFSIIGQWMLNMKVVENWIIWAIVDVIYVFMFIDQKFPASAALYAFFVILCVKGFRDWRRSVASA